MQRSTFKLSRADQNQIVPHHHRRRRHHHHRLRRRFLHSKVGFMTLPRFIGHELPFPPSVTRFGQILPLWRKFQGIWPFLGFILSGKMLNPLWPILYAIEQNEQYLKII